MRQRSTAGATIRLNLPGVALLAAASAAVIFAPQQAQAVMRGHPAGSISRHVVKLVGNNILCTGTVVGRQQVLTANHCLGSGQLFAVVGGQKIAVTGNASSGEATLLTLASPLPPSVEPIATGDATPGGTYTIAGYGTAQETQHMHSAGLREAQLVNDPRYGGLVDPNRRGPISASACMGDSGGPVARFDGKRYILVGIVERVSNYQGIGACGYLTHYSTIGGIPSSAPAPTPENSRVASEPTAPRKQVKRVKQWAEMN